jgi:hypothetical protein
MRISEDRVRRIIREELLREAMGGGDVDERSASLTNVNSKNRAMAAEDVQPLIDRAREKTWIDEARHELALEGLIRFQQINEISGRMSSADPFWRNGFWYSLDKNLATAGAREIQKTIAERRPKQQVWAGWEDSWIESFEHARFMFNQLNESVMVHLQSGGGSPMMSAMYFARAMRELDANPEPLDKLEALRAATKDLTRFFSDPSFEDYHEQVIDLLVSDPEGVLQAAELASSMIM